MTEHIKHIVDAASIVTAIASVATWLPPVAALLSVVWTLLRLIEMFTGKTIAELVRPTP